MEVQFLILFAGVLLTVIVAGFAVISMFGQARSKLSKRASGVRRRLGVEMPDVSDVIRLARDRGDRRALDRFAMRYLPRPEVLRARLERAGLKISLGGYLGVNIILAFTLAGFAIVLGHMPLKIALLAGFAGGFGLPHLYVKREMAKREKAFIKTFPEAIDLIVRTVKSGLPVSEGMAVAAKEMPDPVGGEFKKITENMKFGMNLEDALWDAARRIDNPEFNFFVISLVVQSETGGNLAETLDNLSDILRRRQQIKLKIKAMASEANASAYILGGLPFVVALIMILVSPAYISKLYTDPRGIVLIGVGFVSLFIGVGVMAKMVRFDI